MTSKKEREEEAEGEGLFVYETEEAMLARSGYRCGSDRYSNDCHKPIAIRAMHAEKM